METTLAVIGGKWKLILWHLNEGVRRILELQRLIPGITRKMVTQHLREVKRHGVGAQSLWRNSAAGALGRFPALRSFRFYGQTFAFGCFPLTMVESVKNLRSQQCCRRHMEQIQTSRGEGRRMPVAQFAGSRV